MSTRLTDTQPHRRRAAVVAFVSVSMVLLLGVASLTVDVGLLYNAKADLQRAADAAALAGASAYVSDAALAGRESGVREVAMKRATHLAHRNPTLGTPTRLGQTDIVFGKHDYDKPLGPLVIGGATNAVQVTTRRTTESLDGPIPLVFAAVLGSRYGNVEATARSAFHDGLAGYKGADGVLPFTIHEKIYEDRYLNGPDTYTYDNGIVNAGDGVSEIVLFPWNWQEEMEEVTALETTGEDGIDGQQGTGNFGTLAIGLDSVGTAAVEEQIQTGITSEQMVTEFGTSDLVFYDDEGNPNTYPASGSPGVSVGMEDSITPLLGQVVGFFIHRSLTDHGSGAVYEISGIRFGRLMEVQLSGNRHERAIVIQPVPYTDSNVMVSDNAPSTGGQIGRVVLVQ
ncbi:MAG: pilus assembly protein TadG-related protein [Planctomycetota bacterium]|jgi:hypothetical protein